MHVLVSIPFMARFLELKATNKKKIKLACVCGFYLPIPVNAHNLIKFHFMYDTRYEF